MSRKEVEQVDKLFHSIKEQIRDYLDCVSEFKKYSIIKPCDLKEEERAAIQLLRNTLTEKYLNLQTNIRAFVYHRDINILTDDEKVKYSDELLSLDNGNGLGLFVKSESFNTPNKLFNEAAANDNKKEMNSGNKQNDEYDFELTRSDTTFDDVAGLYEVKEDLLQVVDFMNNGEIYKKYGAKLPKGVLLYGPPGTGKTLLARAVAGECKANFIATNGSDFTARYWGVVPKMIKALFKKAKDNKPCIIFIDEIDMLAMNRSGEPNGMAHREAINAFLSEMDGFEQTDGILVMGATNRIKDLDPAILRAGRFDNLFSVPIPNTVGEVEEIAKIYTKNKKLDACLTTNEIARKMMGSTPAAIEGTINEACIIAVKKNNGIINDVIFDEAKIKKMIKGHLKKEQDLTGEEAKIVACHEAGHALITVMEGKEVQSVNILGTTTGAGGLTVSVPSNEHLWKKSTFEAQLRICYGGRAAEELMYGKENITTGASGDIASATNLIKIASANYGFDLINDNDSAPKIVYEDKQLKMETIEAISQKYYKSTVEMLRREERALRAIIQALLDNGTISGDTVKGLYEQNKVVSL